MTIIFTAITSNLIITAVDSVVTKEFDDKFEYITGRKAYSFPGIGCIATWGTRDCNNIGNYLGKKKISYKNYNVEELADLVFKYLSEEFRPDELGFDDIGYHVTGFDKLGFARLFHVFWGFDRPKPPDQIERKYEKYDHSPQPNEIRFLYNGRNDLAQIAINTFLYQIRNTSESCFHLDNPTSLVQLVDFVIRFGAELTPEVGPPFFIHLIAPQNKFGRLRNDDLCPIKTDNIGKELHNLGYIMEKTQKSDQT